MRIFFLLPALVVVLTLPPGAPASEQAPAVRQGTRTRVDVSKLGPQVGERVPDFTLLDQNGTQQTLQSIMGPRGAMLVFLRSADW